jgi:hypothetical protein
MVQLSLLAVNHPACLWSFYVLHRYLLNQQQEPAAAAAVPTSPEPTAPTSAHKQQQQQKEKDKQQKQGTKDAPVVVELGSVGVALWWEPTRRSHGMGVAERVSFCLLPGEVKVRVAASQAGEVEAEFWFVYLLPCYVVVGEGPV